MCSTATTGPPAGSSPAKPGTPAFIESYATAERSLRERLKGTSADAMRRFEGTEEQPNLGPI